MSKEKKLQSKNLSAKFAAVNNSRKKNQRLNSFDEKKFDLT